MLNLFRLVICVVCRDDVSVVIKHLGPSHWPPLPGQASTTLAIQSPTVTHTRLRSRPVHMVGRPGCQLVWACCWHPSPPPPLTPQYTIQISVANGLWVFAVPSKHFNASVTVRGLWPCKAQLASMNYFAVCILRVCLLFLFTGIIWLTSGLESLIGDSFALWDGGCQVTGGLGRNVTAGDSFSRFTCHIGGVEQPHRPDKQMSAQEVQMTDSAPSPYHSQLPYTAICIYK